MADTPERIAGPVREETAAAEVERQLQVQERDRIQARESHLDARDKMVEYRLGKLDSSVEKLTLVVEKFVEVAASSANRVGFFYRYLLPVIFAILMAFSGYIGIQAKDRADTVCSSVNQARADTVNLLQVFKPLADEKALPLFDTAIEQRKQPVC